MSFVFVCGGAYTIIKINGIDNKILQRLNHTGDIERVGKGMYIDKISINKGLSVDLIADITALTTEEIEKLVISDDQEWHYLE